VFETELARIAGQIQAALDEMGVREYGEIKWVPIPFDGQWGVSTAVGYPAAAAEAREIGHKTDVRERARQISAVIAQKLGVPPGFARVEADKGYLNLYFDTASYARQVVEIILVEGPDFGRGQPKGERLMVEFAQPNTHHSFHIGHLRNAVLGEALARIVEFAGFDTIRASYPGDIGLGVIKCIWAYQKFYQGQEPEGVKERGRWVATVYTRAHELTTERQGETPEERARREQYEAEVRALYQRWDAGDPEVRALWLRTRQWSLDELAEILKTLGVKIDVFFYESQADQLGKAIVEELIQLGVAEDERASGGPVLIKIDEKLGLKKEKYRTAVILRSDGTGLYSTRDLALAKIKFETYHVDRSVYVVDVRQSLYFEQVFKILELWGFPQAAKCNHLAYGYVTLPEGAMSSRKGNVIFFQDVYEEAVRRVTAIIEEKNPDLAGEARDRVALQVGLGALVYAMLAVDNVRHIVFDWDAALNFEGQAAPYIQYAHVRANSILARVEDFPSLLASRPGSDSADGSLPPSPAKSRAFSWEAAEINLIDLLSRFPSEVQRAAEDYKPLYMANYAYDLAKAFNDFYHQVPVLKADQSARAGRIRLVAAARQVLANALGLLGIEAPLAM